MRGRRGTGGLRAVLGWRGLMRLREYLGTERAKNGKGRERDVELTACPLPRFLLSLRPGI